jgi:hypothetical protein
MNTSEYIDSFKVDTIKNEVDSIAFIQSIIYTAVSSTMKLQEVRLSFDKSRNISIVNIILHKNKSGNDEVQILKYIPQEEYDIKVNIKSVLVGEKYYTVKGNIFTRDKYFE